ncbi:MAG: ATP synthase F1 subunit epsilon [Erysipelotrichaceae bacterium]
MIKIKIITPIGLYLSEEVEAIHLKTVDGERTILPNHMPIVAMLATSKLSLKKNGIYDDYAISGGMLQFMDNEARILTDTIEGKTEIDLKRAQEALKRAERRLAKTDSKTNIRRAEIALDKALNRINVSNH